MTELRGFGYLRIFCCWGVNLYTGFSFSSPIFEGFSNAAKMSSKLRILLLSKRQVILWNPIIDNSKKQQTVCTISIPQWMVWRQKPRSGELSVFWFQLDCCCGVLKDISSMGVKNCSWQKLRCRDSKKCNINHAITTFKITDQHQCFHLLCAICRTALVAIHRFALPLKS